MFGSFKESEKFALMRKKQVDTLKVYNEKVTETVEGMEYRVDFVSNGKPLSLIIGLSVDFPMEKPTMRVEPVVSHPWVSSSGEIVSAPGLLKFTIHSELGRVVQAIVREFELRPPPLFDESNSVQESKLSPSASYKLNCSNGDVTVSSALLPLPRSRLEELHRDPLQLDEFVASLPPVLELDKILKEEIAKIETMALENLDQESQLSSLKSEISDKTSTLSQLMDDYQTLSCDYSKLCEKYYPESIRESVLDSISKIDEESEKIAESFLTGGIDLDTFLSDYINHRAVSHSRKFKAENLGCQLRKLHQAGF